MFRAKRQVSRRVKNNRGGSNPLAVPNIRRSVIPQVISQPVFREVFRFRAGAALVSTIFSRCFINLLHLATGATVSYPIIASYKVNRVTAYTIAEGGSGTEVNSVAITFFGGFLGKNSEYTATGTSAIPGVVSKVPPPDSALSFWRSVNMTGNVSAMGEPMLLINSQTTGVIVDIDMSFVLIDGTGLPANASINCSGATVGVLYTNDLDNSTTSGSAGNQNLVPVGRGPLVANG